MYVKISRGPGMMQSHLGQQPERSIGWLEQTWRNREVVRVPKGFLYRKDASIYFCQTYLH